MAQDDLFDIAYDRDNNLLIYCIYDEKGNLCRYHILNDKASLQVSRYKDILSDLELAEKSMEELIMLEKTNKMIGNEIIIELFLTMQLLQ